MPKTREVATAAAPVEDSEDQQPKKKGRETTDQEPINRRVDHTKGIRAYCSTSARTSAGTWMMVLYCSTSCVKNLKFMCDGLRKSNW